MTPEERENTAVFASTGKASVHYENGETLHKGFGFRTEIYTPDDEVEIEDYLYNVDRIIIDEISMVRFDVMEQVLKTVEKIESETGRHIQIILIGDIQQLKPVLNNMDRELLNYYWKDELGFRIYSSWFFLSRRFHTRGFKHLFMYKNLRNQNQEDNRYFNKIRSGDVAACDYFNKRYDENADLISDYIHICVTNAKVDEINEAMVEKFCGRDYIYSDVYFRGDDGIARAANEKYERQIPFKIVLKLFVGMRVMFTMNKEDYKKGELGTIVYIDSSYENRKVIVKKDNGEILEVTKVHHTQEIEGKRQRMLQYPLVPAYAITIHKAQGETFDNVIVHLEGKVQDGQLYTALTRVTDSSGLILADMIKPEMVRPNRFLIHNAYERLFGTYEEAS